MCFSGFVILKAVLCVKQCIVGILTLLLFPLPRGLSSSPDPIALVHAGCDCHTVPLCCLPLFQVRDRCEGCSHPPYLIVRPPSGCYAQQHLTAHRLLPEQPGADR